MWKIFGDLFKGFWIFDLNIKNFKNFIFQQFLLLFSIFFFNKIRTLLRTKRTFSNCNLIMISQQSYLLRFFNFQKGILMRIFLLTCFTIIKIRQNRTFIPDANQRILLAPITSNTGMKNLLILLFTILMIFFLWVQTLFIYHLNNLR